MNELALFAGAGGGILGGKILGWRTVCAVEIDEYARNVLLQRQNDGWLDPFPVWEDVTTFDGRPWRGVVDVVSGGFPCQDISAAGKGAGITGSRSGLWTHMARIIGEIRPRYCFVENSPLLVSRGLDTVLSDLAALGYDARWGVVGACTIGATHTRERMFIVADAARLRIHGEQCNNRTSQTKTSGIMQRQFTCSTGEIFGLQGTSPSVFIRGVNALADRLDVHGAIATRDVGRVAVGVSDRAARLRCIGNGQVPAAAAAAWGVLTND